MPQPLTVAAKKSPMNGMEKPTITRKKAALFTLKSCYRPMHRPSLENEKIYGSVELFEKQKDAQLARDIEIALPVELDRKAQLELVRAYVNDTFVSVGMCADFALHDKGKGNPHAHILLTLRPLKEDGTWGAKCRKEYDLDENGQRIRSERGAYKSHRVDSTDWNDKGKAEIWRSAWSDYVNRSLEQNGIKERVDQRSFERQGIEKIPSVHMGVAATQMERRGISTDKGNINREVAAQNKLLKEMKARITRLYNWSKEQKKQPEKASILDLLKHPTPSKTNSNYGKIKALKESAALFHFLQSNGINSMAELHAKITAMQSDYYALRGEIVSAEREIATLAKHLEIWGQYGANKHPKTDNEKALLESATKYLNELKASGGGITPKKWTADKNHLTAQKNVLYEKMKSIVRILKPLSKSAKMRNSLPRRTPHHERSKTMIDKVTTNLALTELKEPKDIAHARIYDRILERCAPVRFSGRNYRTENAENTKNAIREIFTQEDSL